VNLLPSPPAVATTLSGFVIGVLVTLVASGVIGHASSNKPVATTLVPVRSVGDDLLEAKLQKLVAKVLGPAYPTGPKTRFLSVKVYTLGTGLIPPGVARTYRSVVINFRLNDHPLGHSWRLREAKGDVFALLKNIYTSGLPVYDTKLFGRFSAGSQSLYTAVTAYMSYQSASRIPWKRWGRTPAHEAQVWSLLDYRSIAKKFA
jgi:hypothetical protein